MSNVKFKIIPNAKKTQFIGLVGDMIKVKISSPPIDGRANDELIKFLSKELNIPKGDMKIISGQTSGLKILSVENFDSTSIVKLLNE